MANSTFLPDMAERPNPKENEKYPNSVPCHNDCARNATNNLRTIFNTNNITKGEFTPNVRVHSHFDARKEYILVFRHEPYSVRSGNIG